MHPCDGWTSGRAIAYSAMLSRAKIATPRQFVDWIE